MSKIIHWNQTRSHPRRWNGWILAGLGMATLCGPVRPAIAAGQEDAGFPDVPKTHWAYQAVTDLKQRGILVGYPPAAPAQKASPTARGPQAPGRRPARKSQRERTGR